MHVARNDDPGDYSESDPTQYANYGSGEAYSEYGSAVEPTVPAGYGQTPPAPHTSWHQKPAVLVGLGVLTAAILALLVYAVVKFVGSDTSTPTTTPPATSSSAPSTTQSAAPAPAPTTQTVTESVSPTPTTTVAPPPTTTTTTTTAAPVTTTTEAPAPSTTTTISTSVTTVTETTTKRLWPTIPTFPSPTLYQPPGE